MTILTKNKLYTPSIGITVEGVYFLVIIVNSYYIFIVLTKTNGGKL